MEHLQVAIGVTKGGDGAAADVALDADGFAFLVIVEDEFRGLQNDRHAVAHFKFQPAAGTDDLLGRDAIDSLAHGRMNSMPPPETMNVLNPFARR